MRPGKWSQGFSYQKVKASDQRVGHLEALSDEKEKLITVWSTSEILTQDSNLKKCQKNSQGLDKTFGDIRVNFYKTKASKSLLSLGHLLDQGVHTKQIVGFKKGSYYSKPLK